MSLHVQFLYPLGAFGDPITESSLWSIGHPLPTAKKSDGPIITDAFGALEVCTAAGVTRSNWPPP